VNLQPESNRQLIQQRLHLLYLPICLVFLLLAARLWQLQIIKGSEYVEMAERNRFRTIQVVAPRGTIADRNNIPLVENRPASNILLYREEIKDMGATTRFLTGKLGIKPDDLAARLNRSRASGLYHPVIVKEDAGIGDISVVEAYRRDHPEIELGPEPRRLYRYGLLAAHVLGYVGEISEDELARQQFSGTRAGSLIGKSGVERFYNQYLVGKDGVRQVLVDSLGREVGIIDEIDPIVGKELVLSLDLDLQMVAEQQLKDKVGAIIAMNPQNGEILAMCSSHSFDPNSFATRISAEDWNRLINDPAHPLENRAIQSSYSPGSIFKLIMAEAGLEEGFVDDSTRVFCRGSAVFYGRVFHCAQKNGHGGVNLETAIRRSCNIFFYDLGRRMGISRIAEHARALGLGQCTGIDLPAERSGIMPSPEWKESRGSKWYAGETISVAIGQGAVTTTPIQLLRAVSAIATGGRLVTPHVLLRVEGLPGFPAEWPVRRIAVGEDNAEKIKKGMWESVNDYGTGHNAAIPGVDICGKTGTVQVLSREKEKGLQKDSSAFEDHSWFVGFASRDHPEISVVAFVEHGGMGGIAAAPLAREVFRTYFEKRRRAEIITELKRPLPEVPR
jgi:penicillin-binding protein 2